MSQGEDGKPGRGPLYAAIAGISVALVTGAASITGASFGEDVVRCEIAARFLMEFEGGPPYTDEEAANLTKLFSDVAVANC